MNWNSDILDLLELWIWEFQPIDISQYIGIQIYQNFGHTRIIGIWIYWQFPCIRILTYWNYQNSWCIKIAYSLDSNQNSNVYKFWHQVFWHWNSNLLKFVCIRIYNTLENFQHIAIIRVPIYWYIQYTWISNIRIFISSELLEFLKLAIVRIPMNWKYDISEFTIYQNSNVLKFRCIIILTFSNFKHIKIIKIALSVS